LERHRNILYFSILSLKRKKWKNISIITVFTGIVWIFTSTLFLTGSIKGEALSLLNSAPDLTVQWMVAGRQVPIPIKCVDKIEKILGVKKTVPRIWGYYFDSLTGGNFTIIGIKDNSELNGIIGEGRGIKIPGEVLIGNGIMKARNLKVGSNISLFTQDGRLKWFKLVGRFKGATELESSDLIFMRIDDARDLFFMDKGVATDVVVYLYNDDEARVVARKIKNIYPNTRIVLKKDIKSTYETTFGFRSGVMIIALIASLLSFLILVWERGTSISPDEKREISILRATGWRIPDLLELKLLEGLIISLASFISGIILSYWYIFGLGAPLLRRVIMGWSVIYPSFRLTPYIDAGLIFSIFFFTIIPYISATLIPAWRIATIDPDKGIRGL